MLEKLRNLINKYNLFNTRTSKLKDMEMIDFIDAEGRKVNITRETYRSILLKNINDKWDNPDELYRLLVEAIENGFFKEIEKAATHLVKIDLNHERAICFYGVLQMKLNNYRKAENIFLNYLKDNPNPQSGYTLTNLSKAQHKLGKIAAAINNLEKGLKIDPNQDTGVYLWLAHKVEAAGINLMPESFISNLPLLNEYNKNFGGWKVKTLIGSCYSHLKQKEIAIKWFYEALAESWSPQALTEISGNLGENGFFEEIINLIEPLYIPDKHEFHTGFNLLQAYFELKMVEKGIKLLDRLFALNKQDRTLIKQKLIEWQCNFSKLPGAQKMQTNDGGDALVLAAVNNDIDAMYCLIKQGAAVDHVDDDGCTPLILTSNNGNISLVKNLIDSGAEVNRTNKTGFSALIIAAAKGHIGVVNILLDSGASVNLVTTHGWTALMAASQGNYLDIVDCLLNKGANPYIEAENGATALIFAAQCDHVDILKKLLAKGVDKNKKNKLGQTALDVAISYNNKESVRILS